MSKRIKKTSLQFFVCIVFLVSSIWIFTQINTENIDNSHHIEEVIDALDLSNLSVHEEQLLHEKLEEAADMINQYVADMTDAPSDALLDLLEALKNELQEIEDIQNVDDFVVNAKEQLDLRFAKDEAIQSLLDEVANFDEISVLLEGILDDYISDIESLETTTITEVSNKMAAGIAALRLQESKERHIRDLTDYFEEVSSIVWEDMLDDMWDNVYGTAVSGIISAANQDTIDQIYDNALPLDISYLSQVYIHSVDGQNISTAGHYHSPYRSIDYALNLVRTGTTIMVQSEVIYPVSSTIQVTKDAKIMTADVDINNQEITHSATLRRINEDIPVFVVNPDVTLTLENIIIDGNRTASEANSSATIELNMSTNTNPATLVILDGTEIINGRRSSGGSAIIMRYGQVIMHGGKISGNFRPTPTGTHSDVIGIVGGGSGRIYLYGGEITDNVVNRTAITHGSVLAEIIIGGDFVLNSNFVEDSKTTASNLNIPVNGLKIRDDFTGNVLLNVRDSDQNFISPFGLTIPITIVDDDGNEITGYDLPHINPTGHPELYARYDADNNQFVWDYHYEDFYSVIQQPTLTNSGQMGRQAIGISEGQDMLYKNTVVLPILSKDYYDINFDDAVQFTWKDADAYVWQDDNDHTFTITRQAYYDHVIDGIIDDVQNSLSDYHNQNYETPLPEAVETIIENQLELINIDNFADETSVQDIIVQGQTLIDDYYDLVAAIELAKEELNAYIEDVENPSDALLSILSAAESALDGAEKTDAIEPLVEQYKILLDKQLFDEHQEETIQQIDDYLNTFDSPSEEIIDIIVATKDEIEEASSEDSSIAEIDSLVETMYQALNALLETKKDAVSDALLAITADPSDAVLAIIEDTVDELTLENLADLDDILEAATIAIHTQLFDEYQEKTIQQIDDYLDTFTHPTEDIINIIGEARDEIEEASSIEEIDDLVEEMHQVLDNLLETKKEAVSDALLAITADPSDAVLAIIEDTVDKLTLDNLADIDDIIEAAYDHIIEQLIDESKTLIDAELYDYIAHIEAPSDEIMSLIENAVDSVDETNYKDISQIIADAQNEIDVQYLVDTKVSADAIIDVIIESFDDISKVSPEIHDLLDSAKQRIEDATTVEEIADILAILEANLQEQLDLEEKAEELVAVYNLYANDNRHQYNETGLEMLDQVFAEGEEIIRDSSLSVANKITQLEEVINKLHDVPIFMVGSFDPSDPNFDENGLNQSEFNGVIKTTQPIQSNARIIVVQVEVITGVDGIYDHIENQQLRLMFTEETLEALERILPSHVVFAQLDIRLVDSEDNPIDHVPDNEYEITLLLPESLRERTNIRVVYISDDALEVFGTTRDGNWITFTTNHFSSFYLMGDPLQDEVSPLQEFINLWWVIILLIIVICIEGAIIIWKHHDNHQKSLKTNVFVLPVLAIIIPSHAILMIWILSIIIVLLLFYIIYLFIDWSRFERSKDSNSDEKKQSVTVSKIIEEKVQEVVVKKDIKPESKQLVSPLTLGVKIQYDFSMEARIHQAPKESMQRFNDIKNHLLSYEGVRVSQHWKYEHFIHKNKTIVKITLHGQTIRIYFDLNEAETINSKYNLTFENAKIHRLTPAMLRIKGNRGVKHAIELIDYVFEKNVVKQATIPDEDYRLPYRSREQLIDDGLIRIKESKEDPKYGN